MGAGMVAGRAGAQEGSQPTGVVTGRDLDRRIDCGWPGLEDTLSGGIFVKETLSFFIIKPAVPWRFS